MSTKLQREIEKDKRGAWLEMMCRKEEDVLKDENKREHILVNTDYGLQIVLVPKFI